MKKLLSLLLLAAATAATARQTADDSRQQFTTQGMTVTIERLSPRIVRVHKVPAGETCQERSLSVVLREPQACELDFRVETDRATGAITFSDKQGRVLLRDKPYGTQFTPITDGGQPAYEVRQAFLLDPDEQVFGLGQQQDGRWSQRGQRMRLKNENMKICIPFLHSAKGYGLYWDNYSPTVFADNAQETSFTSEVGWCADYYFIYGPTADDVIGGVRQLTGQAPMYPLWAMGFFQSRERYQNPEELTEVVDKYRQLRVPLDCIVQDWQYWGNHDNWNAISFDNPAFADGKAKAMIDHVHRQHAHIMISVWPSFAPGTEFARQLDSIGGMLSFPSWPDEAGVRPMDVYNPQAGQMYWDRMRRNIFSLGMDAWWLDATEPEIKARSEQELQCPTGAGRTFRAMENAYPLYSNRYVYEGQRALTSDKRVLLLTRSSSFGQQRYASHSWSGDVVANWPTLRRQVTAGMNYSLCGIPYWQTDIGGFYARDYNNDINNPAYRELHVRWYEWGAFQPVMRSHNSGPVAVEIYQFGQSGDWAYDALEKYTRLRYRLIPYLYSTAWQVTAHAGSIIRPFVMDFADDARAVAQEAEYMLGKSFLVSPVTDSLYTWRDGSQRGHLGDLSQAKRVPVYLPRGASWVDFWTGQTLTGGQTVQREVPIDVMPVYVRAGSIVPWGPAVQWAAEKPWSELTLRVYPGADADFTLYEDEGDNYNYEQGSYTEIPMHWDDASQTLTISERRGSFKGMLKRRSFRVVLVGEGHGTGVDDTQRPDRTVGYSGKAVSVRIFPNSSR